MRTGRQVPSQDDASDLMTPGSVCCADLQDKTANTLTRELIIYMQLQASTPTKAEEGIKTMRVTLAVW